MISTDLWITDDIVKFHLILLLQTLLLFFLQQHLYCACTLTQLWLWTIWVCCDLCCVGRWCNRWSLPSWPPPESVYHYCAPTPPATLLHAPGCMPPRRQKVCEEIRDWGSHVYNLCGFSGMNVGYLIDIIYFTYDSSLIPSVLSLSSFFKRRQRASQLRWILIRLWWRTSSVWMKWRRTWLVCLMLSKMTSHATSAFEPHQVFSLSLFFSGVLSHVSPKITLFFSFFDLQSSYKKGWSRLKKLKFTIQVTIQKTKTT